MLHDIDARQDQIKRIIALLQKRWQMTPALRLGQIIVNSKGHVDCPAIFYYEDDDLEQSLKKQIGTDSR